MHMLAPCTRHVQRNISPPYIATGHSRPLHDYLALHVCKRAYKTRHLRIIRLAQMAKAQSITHASTLYMLHMLACEASLIGDKYID